MARGRGKSKKSSRGGSRRSSKKKDANFIGIGNITIPKKYDDDEDMDDICDDLMDMEAQFNLKVFLGKEESITLYEGDMIMIKFKEYEKNPDFAVGKVFIIDED